LNDIVRTYVPRPHFIPLHMRQERWACLVVHRRGGKTYACIEEIVTRAGYTQKSNARYAYVAPFYRQAKDVAWVYLKESTAGLSVKVRESELRVELFNGAWITLYGADNPDALRGLYLDGVVLDEYGDCRPSLWGTVVLPCLADRKGWAIFIGTAKGKNHFFDVHQRAEESANWYSLKLPASVSGVLDDEELLEMKAQMTDDAYRQEMECDFTAAVIGTYYATQISEMENTGKIAVNTAEYDPDQSVYVASDLGFSDSTALWFWQKRPDGFAIIDHYENQGEQLGHYLRVLTNKGYDYDTFYLPHDAKARTLQTGRSTVEQVRDYMYDEHPDTHIAIVPKLAVQHGIDAVRLILSKCHFNQTRCKEGIESLRAYRRTYDEVNKCFSDQPKHDWASDSADAFRYFALVAAPGAVPAKLDPSKTRIKRAEGPQYKLEQLFEEREAGLGTRQYQKLRMG
jgi:phage terminase large subunit